MAGIDKALIVIVVAIISIAIGGTLFMGASQDAGPTVATPPTVSTETSEPETPTSFGADLAAKVREEAGMSKKDTVKPMMSGWDRLTSDVDPGMGHESHQLAIILAPSSNVYSGTLMYDASEPIQLVALRGPLAEGEDKGLKTWTMDGETIFELTFVDLKNAKGEWKFSGNALAVHTMKTSPFIVDYKVVDLSTSETEKTVVLEEEVAIADVEDKHEETMDEEPVGPQTHTVDVPAGTSVPGCEETNSCFTPADITINAGDTVEWNNIDTAAHTVTSGSPAEGPSGIFDSSLLMADASFAVTFDDTGKYVYFCMVHPWMVGTVLVN